MKLRNIAAHLAGVLFVLTLATSANAITKTIFFTASDLEISGVGNPFDNIGVTAQQIVTGSFTFDTNAPPTSSAFTQNPGTNNESTFQRLPFLSFTASIGGTILNGVPAPTSSNQIFVVDGTGLFVRDRFIIDTYPSSPLPFGKFFGMSIFLDTLTDVFVGNAVPTVAALNAMSADDGQHYFLLLTQNSNNQLSRASYSTVVFSEISAVPVPAALPLFGTGLALMGFIGWRRKRNAA